MSDRSAAEAFGCALLTIWEACEGAPDYEKGLIKALARRIAGDSRHFDFTPDQLDVDQALIGLGLAKPSNCRMGDPNYDPFGEAQRVAALRSDEDQQWGDCLDFPPRTVNPRGAVRVLNIETMETERPATPAPVEPTPPAIPRVLVCEKCHGLFQASVWAFDILESTKNDSHEVRVRYSHLRRCGQCRGD